MKHILSVDQFNKDDLAGLVATSCYYKANFHDRDILEHARGKVLSNLFYEPSTRTSSSFYSAMVRLGGNVIPINDVSFSSVSKGETLEDTIRTMASYSEAIVLRHKEVGAAERAAAVSSVPIINAGDGVGEHPTQALLDFLTIFMERTGDPNTVMLTSTMIAINNMLEDMLSGMRITMMGDLKHGRTVKSLSKLGRLYGVKVNWVSPEEFRIPSEYLEPDDIETDDLNEVIANSDVLYVVRAQKERFDESLFEKSPKYGVTLDHMEKAKSNLILMHPLPRTDELPTTLDTDPRSAYFRQMRYGLYMRMAVLSKVLSGVGGNQ